jgi:hypothetical protein
MLPNGLLRCISFFSGAPHRIESSFTLSHKAPFYVECVVCHNNNYVSPYGNFQHLGAVTEDYFMCNSKETIVCGDCLAPYQKSKCVEGNCAICHRFFLRNTDENKDIPSKGSDDWIQWEDNRLYCFDCVKEGVPGFDSSVEMFLLSFKKGEFVPSEELRGFEKVVGEMSEKRDMKRFRLEDGTNKILKYFQGISGIEARDVASKLTDEQLARFLGFSSSDEKDFIFHLLTK